MGEVADEYSAWVLCNALYFYNNIISYPRHQEVQTM